MVWQWLAHCSILSSAGHIPAHAFLRTKELVISFPLPTKSPGRLCRDCYHGLLYSHIVAFTNINCAITVCCHTKAITGTNQAAQGLHHHLSPLQVAEAERGSHHPVACIKLQCWNIGARSTEEGGSKTSSWAGLVCESPIQTPSLPHALGRRIWPPNYCLSEW